MDYRVHFEQGPTHFDCNLHVNKSLNIKDLEKKISPLIEAIKPDQDDWVVIEGIEENHISYIFHGKSATFETREGKAPKIKVIESKIVDYFVEHEEDKATQSFFEKHFRPAIRCFQKLMGYFTKKPIAFHFDLFRQIEGVGPGKRVNMGQAAAYCQKILGREQALKDKSERVMRELNQLEDSYRTIQALREKTSEKKRRAFQDSTIKELEKLKENETHFLPVGFYFRGEWVEFPLAIKKTNGTFSVEMLALDEETEDIKWHLLGTEKIEGVELKEVTPLISPFIELTVSKQVTSVDLLTVEKGLKIAGAEREWLDPDVAGKFSQMGLNIREVKPMEHESLTSSYYALQGLENLFGQLKAGKTSSLPQARLAATKGAAHTLLTFLKSTTSDFDFETFLFAGRVKAVDDLLKESDAWLKDPEYKEDALTAVRNLRQDLSSRLQGASYGDIKELQKIGTKLERLESKVLEAPASPLKTKISGLQTRFSKPLVLPQTRPVPKVVKGPVLRKPDTIPSPPLTISQTDVSEMHERLKEWNAHLDALNQNRQWKQIEETARRMIRVLPRDFKGILRSEHKEICEQKGGISDQLLQIMEHLGVATLQLHQSTLRRGWADQPNAVTPMESTIALAKMQGLLGTMVEVYYPENAKELLNCLFCDDYRGLNKLNKMVESYGTLQKQFEKFHIPFFKNEQLKTYFRLVRFSRRPSTSTSLFQQSNLGRIIGLSDDYNRKSYEDAFICSLPDKVLETTDYKPGEQMEQILSNEGKRFDEKLKKLQSYVSDSKSLLKSSIKELVKGIKGGFCTEREREAICHAMAFCKMHKIDFAVRDFIKSCFQSYVDESEEREKYLIFLEGIQDADINRYIADNKKTLVDEIDVVTLISSCGEFGWTSGFPLFEVKKRSEKPDIKHKKALEIFADVNNEKGLVPRPLAALRKAGYINETTLFSLNREENRTTIRKRGIFGNFTEGVGALGEMKHFDLRFEFNETPKGFLHPMLQLEKTQAFVLCDDKKIPDYEMEGWFGDCSPLSHALIHSERDYSLGMDLLKKYFSNPSKRKERALAPYPRPVDIDKETLRKVVKLQDCMKKERDLLLGFSLICDTDLCNHPEVLRYLEEQLFRLPEYEVGAERIQEAMGIISENRKRAEKKGEYLLAARALRLEEALKAKLLYEVKEEQAFVNVEKLPTLGPLDSFLTLIRSAEDAQEKALIAKECLFTAATRRLLLNEQTTETDLATVFAANMHYGNVLPSSEEYAFDEREVIAEMIEEVLPQMNSREKVEAVLSKLAGEFPNLKIKTFEFPEVLLEGDMLLDLKMGGLLREGKNTIYLPKRIVQNSTFLSLFSKKEGEALWELRRGVEEEKGVNIYQSPRYPGVYLVDVIPPRIYKTFRYQGKEVTVQHVTFESLENEYSLKEDFPQEIAKAIGAANYFIDPNDPSRVYVFKGEKLFGTLKLKKEEEGVTIQGFTHANGSHLLTPPTDLKELFAFSGLEDAERMRLWGSEKQVKKIEYATLIDEQGKTLAYETTKEGMRSLNQKEFYLRPRGEIPRVPFGVEEQPVLPNGFDSFHLLENATKEQLVLLAPKEYRIKQPKKGLVKAFKRVRDERIVQEPFDKRFERVPYGLEEIQTVFRFQVSPDGYLRSEAKEGELYLAYLFALQGEYEKALEYLQQAEALSAFTAQAEKIYQWIEEAPVTTKEMSAFKLKALIHLEEVVKKERATPLQQGETRHEIGNRASFLNRFAQHLTEVLQNERDLDPSLLPDAVEWATSADLWAEIMEKKITPTFEAMAPNLSRVSPPIRSTVQLPLSDRDKRLLTELLWTRASAEKKVDLNKWVVFKNPEWVLTYFPQLLTTIQNAGETEKAKWKAALLALPLDGYVPLPRSLSEALMGNGERANEVRRGLRLARDLLLEAMEKRVTPFSEEIIQSLKKRPSTIPLRTLALIKEPENQQKLAASVSRLPGPPKPLVPFVAWLAKVFFAISNALSFGKLVFTVYILGWFPVSRRSIDEQLEKAKRYLLEEEGEDPLSEGSIGREIGRLEDIESKSPPEKNVLEFLKRVQKTLGKKTGQARMDAFINNFLDRELYDFQKASLAVLSSFEPEEAKEEEEAPVEEIPPAEGEAPKSVIQVLTEQLKPEGVEVVQPEDFSIAGALLERARSVPVQPVEESTEPVVTTGVTKEQLAPDTLFPTPPEQKGLEAKDYFLGTPLGREHKKATETYLQTHPQLTFAEERVEEAVQTLEQEISTTKRAYSETARALQDLFRGEGEIAQFTHKMREKTGERLIPSLKRLHGLYVEGQISDAFLKKYGIRKSKEEVVALIEQELLLSIKQKHLQTCLEKTKEAKKGGVFFEDAYQWVHKKRCFDYKHPHYKELLLIEYENGFLIREDQVAIITNMINDPSMVSELPMGGGKSKVILPVLAKAKCTGKNLVMVLVPNALLAINKRDLQATAKQTYGQNLFTFEFDINREITPEALERQYRRLKEAKAKKEFVLTTKSALLSYRNFYLAKMEELPYLEGAKKGEVELLTGIMEQTLSLLKEDGEVVADEIHDILDVKKEDNMSLTREGETIPQLLQDTAVELFKKITENQELLTILEQNTQADLSDEKREGYLRELALASLPAKKRSEDLINFILGKESPIESIEEGEDKEFLCALKGLLSEGLGYTLRKSADRHYGRHGLFTIPYKGANTPSVGSVFDKEVEKLCFTLQDYLYKGVPEELISNYFQSLLTSAKRESLERGIPIADTQAGREYDSLFSHLKVEGLPSSLSQYNSRYMSAYKQALNSSADLKLKFAQRAVLPKIRVYNKQVKANPHTLCNLVKAFQGFTGTNWCPKSYPKEVKSSEEASQVIGKSYAVLQKIWDTIEVKTVSIDPNRGPESLLEQSGFPDTSPVLIDSGAYLKGVKNEDFIELALARAPASIEGAIFANHLGELVYKGKRDKQAVLLKDAPKIPKEKILTLYDEDRCTGTDVKQGSDARATVTVAADSTCTSVFQAMWRMRQLGQGQTLTFVVSNEIKQLIKPGEEPLIFGDIIQFLEQNEEGKGHDYHYIGDIKRINSFYPNILSNLRETLANQPGKEALSSIFVETKDPKAVLTQYAQRLKLEDPSIVLAEIRDNAKRAFDACIATLSSGLQQTIRSSIAEQEETFLSSPFLDAAFYPEQVARTEDVQEVAVEQQVEQQVEIQVQTHTRTEMTVEVTGRRIPTASYTVSHFYQQDYYGENFQPIEGIKEGKYWLASNNLLSSTTSIFYPDSPKIAHVFLSRKKGTDKWVAIALSASDVDAAWKAINYNPAIDRTLGEEDFDGLFISIGNQAAPLTLAKKGEVTEEDQKQIDQLLLELKMIDGNFTFSDREKRVFDAWIQPGDQETKERVKQFIYKNIVPKLTDEEFHTFQYSYVRRVLEPEAFKRVTT